MPTPLKIEITGDSPATHAIPVLQQYVDNEDVESVSIEIVTKEKEETVSGSAESTDLSSFDDKGPGVRGSEDGEEHSEAEEKEREKGNIQGNTSHHRVLYALASLSNGEMVPSKEIKQHTEGVSGSSISPALTQLWERQLVDREHVDDVANPYYRYKPTEYGLEKLDELGEPEGEQ